MTRRDALKRMGTTVASMAIASSGLLSSLASCGERSKKRIILYFTGTGNCLYVARQLAGEHGELLSIPQLMKQKQIEIEADEIGLVYPIYGHMPESETEGRLQVCHPYLRSQEMRRRRDLGSPLPQGRQCVRLHQHPHHGG